MKRLSIASLTILNSLFQPKGRKSKATLRSERSSFGELALAFLAKIDWRFLSKHETISWLSLMTDNKMLYLSL